MCLSADACGVIVLLRISVRGFPGVPCPAVTGDHSVIPVSPFRHHYACFLAANDAGEEEEGGGPTLTAGEKLVSSLVDWCDQARSEAFGECMAVSPYTGHGGCKGGA